MKFPRRQFLQLVAGAAAPPAISRVARAQAYPARPVRLIVGFPPGSATDLFGRLAGQWLSERLDQPFVIELLIAAFRQVSIVAGPRYVTLCA
jgi:tripartite-type tricarboxylate transporter receptor subunit TctC